MGAFISSEFSREDEADANFLVEHHGLGSPWSHFALRRYGAGFAATGVSSSCALPRLLRRRIQDWSVQGCAVHLGSNFVSFGRKLESISRPDGTLFYGIDIFFGDNTNKASWFWYCRPHEWLLQLHKAVLEPLPAPPPAVVSVPVDQRWPGRPRFLGESAQQAAAAAAAAAEEKERKNNAPNIKKGGDVEAESELGDSTTESDVVDHQLSLFLSNADGHVGLLVLPIPREQVEVTTRLVAHWSATCEVPLEWATRTWTTAQDFIQLRESALNMPDILLLGLETELAMALTPDWTWEKYPRGYGDVASPQSIAEANDEAAQLAEAMRLSAEEEGASGRRVAA